MSKTSSIVRFFYGTVPGRILLKAIIKSHAERLVIIPCDGWLSVHTIQKDSSFSIKGSHYRIADLLQDTKLADLFQDGDCLIFRLCASDYHHYCYIDDCYQGAKHFIPGILHSVQPIACETYQRGSCGRRMLDFCVEVFTECVIVYTIPSSDFFRFSLLSSSEFI